MIAPGQELWLVATGVKDETKSQEKSDLWQRISSSPALTKTQKFQFPVPDGSGSLMFGSFDNLIRLTDDLQKSDSQVDSIVHRLERQWLEMDPRAPFKVRAQRQEKTFQEYMQTWTWDEAKYPRSRSITDTMAHLMATLTKIDDEARNKTVVYNESKATLANLTSKDGGNLMSRDLVDVLTPTVINMKGSANDDFIQTDHLTTVFVILPRGSEPEFLAGYEEMSSQVVPQSARKFEALTDKDGNSLYRVVMFKKGVEEFKKVCREKRLAPRDFEYSEEGYNKLMAQRQTVKDAAKKQFETLKGLYQAAWSDAMAAWFHIKAMRIFVESVLRYGMPPSFAAFVIVAPSAQPAARKALEGILGKPSEMNQGAKGEEEEDYFPYVSFNLTPFTAPRSSR